MKSKVNKTTQDTIRRADNAVINIQHCVHMHVYVYSKDRILWKMAMESPWLFQKYCFIFLISKMIVLT